ncbi:hypothetical protein PENSPDRAFT_680464 [Peniophora sp. CONT]|nr:hypothetical protein PENSPDRAFT_680464 [Peniophora sp. CONT]
MDTSSSDAASQSRFQPSKNLRKDAKGAMKTAIDVLSIAASMTQGVPYLGIVSGALTEFVKMADEVDAFKSDWKAVTAVARQIQSIIDEMRDKYKQAEEGGTFPQELAKPFEELERCIGHALETLNNCKIGSKRLRDRARAILNRGDLSSDVKQCRADMQAALDLFNTKLNIINAIALDGFINKRATALPANAVTAAAIVLPPAPGIFYGREQEVDHIVNLFSKTPARVTILGSGGIGKTSIALTVLHHPKLVEAFAERRYFLSCEAVSTADGIVQELLNMFGLVHDPKGNAIPLNVLLSYLKTVSTVILCLDNIETPWDADIEAVEMLLSMFANLPNLSLIVTSRGTDRPMGVAWTRPLLPPIVPLAVEAALQTWEMICDSRDEYAERLVKAVDCVPLAVTLLAHLAQSESSEVLWTRWEEERTELLRVRGPEHRLNNVERSIELTLSSPRLRDDTSSLLLLSTVCALPQGLRECHMSAYAKSFAEHLPKLRQSVTTLKQCSLAYSSQDGFLRVLSPVRHYMQTRRPITDPLFTCLSDFYCKLVDQPSNSYAADVVYSRHNIQPELGNISSILSQSLTRSGDSPGRFLRAVVAFTDRCRCINFFDIVLVLQAIDVAKSDSKATPELLAHLYQAKGEALHFQGQHLYPHARAAFKIAYQYYYDIHISDGIGLCLQRIGEICHHLGDFSHVEMSLELAMEYYSESKNSSGQADCLLSLATYHVHFGRLEHADEAIKAALDRYKKTDNRLGEATSLRELASVYILLDRHSDADNTLFSSVKLSDEIGDRLGEAHTLRIAAEMFIRDGLFDTAEVAINRAISLYENLGSSSGKVDGLCTLGLLYHRLQQWDKAIDTLETALEISHHISYKVGHGLAIIRLADVSKDNGDPDLALGLLATAIQLFGSIYYAFYENMARERLFNLCLEAQAAEEESKDGESESAPSANGESSSSADQALDWIRADYSGFSYGSVASFQETMLDALRNGTYKPSIDASKPHTFKYPDAEYTIRLPRPGETFYFGPNNGGERNDDDKDGSEEAINSPGPEQYATDENEVRDIEGCAVEGDVAKTEKGKAKEVVL